MTEYVAFDIDGTLTTQEGRSAYWEYVFEEDTTVGIITARPMSSAKRFLDEQGMNPAFIESTLTKNRAMERIADEGTYYADRLVDQGYARMAGWDFVKV